MNLTSDAPLAPLTTLGVGGAARFFIEAKDEKEIEEAIAFAKEQNLPLFVLGNGSNVLVPDTGIEGVVVKMAIAGVMCENEGESAVLTAGAGTPWEEVVDAASGHNLFGIENLAGIPGTVGGAAVQNIGAYGAELAAVFAYAECIDAVTGERSRVGRNEAAFGYRTSFFKKHRELVVVRVALCLSKKRTPNLAYPDLARAQENGVPLETPAEIASAIRAIRAEKFPYAPNEGTAGSFFKNPVVSSACADALAARFPGLPLFPQGEREMKLPLSWLLDHALALKGFARGKVRLYEQQPLVIVARRGATAVEVEAFADEIAERVYKATGIIIDREVELFGATKEV